MENMCGLQCISMLIALFPFSNPIISAWHDFKWKYEVSIECKIVLSPDEIKRA